MTNRPLVFVCLLWLLLAACSEQDTDTPTAAAPIPSAVVATTAPSPTPSAPSPPPGPTPTDTAEPEPTAIATPTPTATAAPEPTLRRSISGSSGPRILPGATIPFLTPTVITRELLPEALDPIGSRVTVSRELPTLRPIDRDLLTRDELADLLLEDFEESREEIGDTGEGGWT